MESAVENQELLGRPSSSESESQFHVTSLRRIPSQRDRLQSGAESTRGQYWEGLFLWKGKRVILRVTPTHVEWSAEKSRPSCLQFTEILAVTSALHPSRCCSSKGLPELCVHSFERCRKRRSLWRVIVTRFAAADVETLNEGVSQIEQCLHKLTERPRQLWVFINPYGGAKRAPRIWKAKVGPLFKLAGIECEVHITKRANEAHACVQSISPAALRQFDGIVVVGGDGLFQEVMNGLLEKQQGQKPSLRLGHIPAGSTDAVAWSINGSRCPVSAALRIIVGDRLPLDVMHVQSEKEKSSKYSACLAGYGFLGDVISLSENLRWCGPVRYDIAGAAVFLSHQSHRARVSFVRAQQPDRLQQECMACCLWCQGKKHELSLSDGRLEADVEVVEGEFVSVMITVIPCRSDKSPSGLMPHAHLSDGRMHLTLVKKCPRWRYLSFLVSLAKHGVIPGKHDFVQTIDAKWARVEPLDGQSAWNVDGELLKEQTITSVAHRGLLEVFARGVEAQQ